MYFVGVYLLNLLILFELYMLESTLWSFSRPVLHATTSVVQEMGKIQDASFSLGVMLLTKTPILKHFWKMEVWGYINQHISSTKMGLFLKVLLSLNIFFLHNFHKSNVGSKTYIFLLYSWTKVWTIKYLFFNCKKILRCHLHSGFSVKLKSNDSNSNHITRYLTYRSIYLCN